MFTNSILIVVLLVCCSVVWGGSQFRLESAELVPMPTCRTGTLDNPEPDTLSYDDSGASYFIQSISNYYAYVRFTPSAAFQLRSLYLGLGDHIGSAQPCSVWVCLPNGTAPGQELAFTTFSPSLGSQMYDITLENAIDIEAQQDFLVIIGRVPGYTTGWSPFLDASSTTNRSFVTLGNRLSDTYESLPYDFRIRAGGSLMTFADLSAEECFNDVNGSGPAFFLEHGDSVTLKTRVKNLSNQAVTGYSVSWTVSDNAGTIVFAEVRDFGSLDPLAEAIVSTLSDFIPADEGMYMVSSAVSAPGDAVSDNDTTTLRLFATQPPTWLRYDDTEMDGGAVHGQGWAIGVSFRPSRRISKIGSVRVSCGTSGTASMRIYYNNSAGEPSTAPIWTATQEFSSGWNSIDVVPPIPSPARESITVTFVFNGTIALGVDNTPPNAAANSGMGTVSWLSGPSGWNRDQTGNWMIQAFADTLTSLPPLAFIHTNPVALVFGAVDTAGSLTRSIPLWIANAGIHDSLHVSQMLLQPSWLETAFSISPSEISVAAGDSAAVLITFDPSEVRIYNGTLQITNSSFNQPVAVLQVQAAGSTSSPVIEDERTSVKGFTLGQVYPNPFNSSATISFTLPKASEVMIGVYDVLGRKTDMAGHVPTSYGTGTHSIAFDGSGLASGVYFVRVEAGGMVMTRKMLLLK